MRRRTLLRAGVITPALAIFSSLAQRISPDVAALRRFLALPESQIDIATVKLAIDKMVDPRADIQWAERQLEELTAAASAIAGMRPFAQLPPVDVRVNAIRSCLYRSGPWNANKPFRYDLKNDPTGTKIVANKLLPHYLQTRLGNCVSMPALFLILAHRLKLDAALSTAPEHTFVKVRAESGTYSNHECTDDGGLKADSSYVREFEITPVAINKGVYLQPLTRKQTIVVMAGTLGEHYSRTDNVTGLHALADLMLEHEPDALDGIRTKMAAYGLTRDVRYRRKYARFEDMPPVDRADAIQLLRTLSDWEARAHALGWRPPSSAFEANYKRLVGAASPRS
jgi:regulator of sirC expression with transglutaminase-like and TPR domain